MDKNTQLSELERKREWEIEQKWKKITFFTSTTLTIIGMILTYIVTPLIKEETTQTIIYNGDVITYQMYGEAIGNLNITEAEMEDAYNVSVGKTIALAATEYCVGNSYVYGGSSLTNGADASGLVMLLYGKYGIELPHSSKSIALLGEEIGVEDIRDGDIVCYDGHVGIYVGEGMIVHASNPRKGITIENMDYRDIITIRRFDFAKVQGLEK